TRSPTTEVFWRGSGRVGTVTPCRRCAPRVPRRGWDRRRIVILLPSVVIVARRVVMRWLVCTICRTTRTRVGRTFFCGPSVTGRGRRPIAPRQPTTGHGRPPTGRRQPVNAPRRVGTAPNLQTA